MSKVSIKYWVYALLFTLVIFSAPAFSQVMTGNSAENSGQSPQSNTGLEHVNSGRGVVHGTEGGTIPSLIGLDTDSMTSGIGAGYLGTLLGAEMFNRVAFNISGVSTNASLSGSENPTFGGLLRFGTYLGVALTTILMMFHGVIMFFNKMEYGDVLGEAKDRFIGFTRGVLAFALVLPIAANGYAAAQYVTGYVALASNGIGNKAATTVMLSGFGAPSSSLNVFNVSHDISSDQSAAVLSAMVGQHGCSSALKALNASPQEIRDRCNSLVFDYSDFDVGGNADEIMNGTDESYCWQNHSGLLGGVRPLRRFESISGGDAEDAFQRRLCLDLRKIQRDAHTEIGALYEQYEDLESEAAQQQMIIIADKYNNGIQKVIDDINTGAFGTTYPAHGDGGGGATTYLSDELSNFIGEVGWPGLGLIYSTIGAQIDAVSGLQGVNTEEGSAGFSISRMQEAGRQANAALLRVRSDQAMARAAAMTEHSSSENASYRSLGGAGIDYLTDGVYRAFQWVDEGSQEFYISLFSPVFEDPGPVATHKIGSTVLGAVLIGAAGHDFLQLPGVRNVASGPSKFASLLADKLNPLTTSSEADGGGESILLKMAGIYIATLLMLTLLVATFLVMIIPKLPVFFVSFLALEWAIWCAIIVFASPLWIALNLTTVSNQPGLFTQRAMSGLGILLYLLLFPPLVVAAVVISVLAYNLIIPVLSGLMLMAFGGGIVETILGILAMPFIFLLALLIGSFVAISAIPRIPRMITTLLGIQEPGDSVSSSMTNFVASPMHFNNIQNPQSMVTGAVGAMSGRGARKR